jgi:hypothetical protein
MKKIVLKMAALALLEDIANGQIRIRALSLLVYSKIKNLS